MQQQHGASGKGKGKGGPKGGASHDPALAKLWCSSPQCSAWVYVGRGVRFCHICGGQFQYPSSPAPVSQGKGAAAALLSAPPGPQRSFAQVAASQPAPFQSAPAQHHIPPQPASAAQVPNPRTSSRRPGRELSVLAKARTEVTFYAQTYGQESPECQQAVDKL